MHLSQHPDDILGSGGSVGGPPVASHDPASVKPQLRDGIDMARLIGAPQVFGRVKPLRNGFMVEPTATLTLQPDGRVTGHGHPNEGSWTSYGLGEVPADEAFAFVSGGNGYIPSSTWTQSLGDMPIGHFCDEPEDVQAVQRLCLIPPWPGAAR